MKREEGFFNGLNNVAAHHFKEKDESLQLPADQTVFFFFSVLFRNALRRQPEFASHGIAFTLHKGFRTVFVSLWNTRYIKLC